jgi:group I intron endonuclease
MACAVYEIVNTANGWRYVGSSRVVETRWSTHRRQLTNGNHKNERLQAAWNKLGASVFAFRVIVVCRSLEEARQREDVELKALIDSTTTYNLCFDSKGALLSEASVHKIREKLRGRRFSDDHRNRIAKAITGRPYSAQTRAKIGAYSATRVHSAETRAKIGASLLGGQRASRRNMRIFTFRHECTGETVTLPAYVMRITYNLSMAGFSTLTKGRLRSFQGWTIPEFDITGRRRR